MTRLRTELWSTPYSMVILPRCAAPRRKYSPTIWTNLKFQQCTALADPNWTFIHFSHSIELIDKHRDTDSGLFNLADLTSVIRYLSCPRIWFSQPRRWQSSQLRSTCARVWVRGEGGCRGLFCPHCTELQLLQTRATKSQWQWQRLRDSVTTL